MYLILNLTLELLFKTGEQMDENLNEGLLDNPKVKTTYKKVN